MTQRTVTEVMLLKLGEFRRGANLSEAQVEEQLLLGPGWIERFESGKTVPAIDLLFTLLSLYGKSPSDLFQGATDRSLHTPVVRAVYGEELGSDLLIKFAYASHDATYTLKNATLAQFNSVVKSLRDGLARLTSYSADVEEVDEEADETTRLSKAELKQIQSEIKQIKSDSVAATFLRASRLWPDANPSDLWYFLVYRAYCDPFNHPASFARLNLDQSWKRTGGWALEQVLVRFYAEHLKSKGINLFFATKEQKQVLATAFSLPGVRVESDKIDVYLTGDTPQGVIPLGIIHVKASLAERRTSDTPLSEKLIQAGYVSPFWTMDCKSVPSTMPVNKGELGRATLTSEAGMGRRERISAKRKDVEESGSFSACFAYNSNTEPTVQTPETKAIIHVCNFKSPDDAFTKYLVDAWEQFKKAKRLNVPKNALALVARVPGQPVARPA